MLLVVPLDRSVLINQRGIEIARNRKVQREKYALLGTGSKGEGGSAPAEGAADVDARTAAALNSDADVEDEDENNGGNVGGAGGADDRKGKKGGGSKNLWSSLPKQPAVGMIVNAKFDDDEEGAYWEKGLIIQTDPARGQVMCIYDDSNDIGWADFPDEDFELEGYAKKAWQKERTAWLASVKLPQVDTKVRVRASIGSEEWVLGKVVNVATDDFKVQVRKASGNVGDFNFPGPEIEVITDSEEEVDVQDEEQPKMKKRRSSRPATKAAGAAVSSLQEQTDSGGSGDEDAAAVRAAANAAKRRRKFTEELDDDDDESDGHGSDSSGGAVKTVAAKRKRRSGSGDRGGGGGGGGGGSASKKTSSVQPAKRVKGSGRVAPSSSTSKSKGKGKAKAGGGKSQQERTELSSDDDEAEVDLGDDTEDDEDDAEDSEDDDDDDNDEGGRSPVKRSAKSRPGRR